MIKAFIFDFDGTLLNRDASLGKFVEVQYERLKQHFPHVAKENYVQRFIQLDQRGYTWRDKVYQQLTSEFEIKKLKWEELLDDYNSNFQHNCIPFPHLYEMLENLKNQNVQLGMITNGIGHFQMANIKALKIENYFETILISEWEGIAKPHPEIFKRALDKLKVSPKEALFIGDHPEFDVSAAQQVGMYGIWKRDSHWAIPKADFIIDDLDEVPLLLEKISLY